MVRLDTCQPLKSEKKKGKYLLDALYMYVRGGDVGVQTSLLRG